MITFGAVRSLPEANLRALRCAVAIQEAMERLSQSGRTTFQMGLSLHSGRVFVASFLVDDRDKETTVIGRQVNLAARISTTHTHRQSDMDEGMEEKSPGDSMEQRERLRSISPSSAGAVFVDDDGCFYNVGVAASDKFLFDLQKTVEMEVISEEGRRGHRFYDQYLKSEVTFYYLDDIHFKGVHGATPIYGISWRRKTGDRA
jgi:hypothetical protein